MELVNLLRHTRKTNKEFFYYLVGSNEIIDFISEYVPDIDWYVINQEYKEGYKIGQEIIKDKCPITTKKYNDEGVEIKVYLCEENYLLDITLDNYHQLLFCL